MTKLTLLAVVFLASGLTALAQLNSLQDPYQPTPQSSGLASDKPQIRGCVSRDESGTGFVLTNQQYVKGVPVVSSKDLAAHVGQTVQLTGAWKKDASANVPADPENRKMRTFHASNIRELSAKCIALPKDDDLGIRTSIYSSMP